MCPSWFPLTPNASEEDETVGQATLVEWYQTSSDCLQEVTPGDTVHDQWLALRDATVQAASTVLGKKRRRQTDWFAASATTLQT